MNHPLDYEDDDQTGARVPYNGPRVPTPKPSNDLQPFTVFAGVRRDAPAPKDAPAVKDSPSGSRPRPPLKARAMEPSEPSQEIDLEEIEDTSDQTAPIPVGHGESRSSVAVALAAFGAAPLPHVTAPPPRGSVPIAPRSYRDDESDNETQVFDRPLARPLPTPSAPPPKAAPANQTLLGLPPLSAPPRRPSTSSFPALPQPLGPLPIVAPPPRTSTIPPASFGPVPAPTPPPARASVAAPSFLSPPANLPLPAPLPRSFATTQRGEPARLDPPAPRPSFESSISRSPTPFPAPFPPPPSRISTVPPPPAPSRGVGDTWRIEPKELDAASILVSSSSLPLPVVQEAAMRMAAQSSSPSSHPPASHSSHPPSASAAVAVVTSIPRHLEPVPETRPRVTISAPPAPILMNVPVPAAAPSAPAPARMSRLGIALGAVAFLLTCVLAAMLLMPRSGRLKVALASDDAAATKAEVYVDGEKRCEVLPCTVNDLGPGPKTIQVIAQGYQPFAITESVESGKERLVLVQARSASSAAPTAPAAPAAGDGGLVATGNQAGVRVLVDGADHGTLPLRMTSLAAGQHRVRFEGDRYQPFERTVDVGRGQTIDLGAIQLKIAKAKLTLEVSDNNAKVVLTDVDAHSERTIKGPFPATLDLDGGHRWLVTATARGSRDFATDVSFDDGQADKTVRVALTSGSNGSGGPVVASGPAAAPAPRAAARAKEDASDDDAKPAPSGAMGSLNMNSLPPSKVLLDGRPLGSTPKVGVSVPAGTHTVTFVHPDLGRKTVSVNVPANGEASAGVRFKKEED